jgi:hypothetical protein
VARFSEVIVEPGYFGVSLSNLLVAGVFALMEGVPLSVST